MKENDARVDFGEHTMALFVEKDDGSYGPIETGSFLAKNYLSEFWQKMKHFHETAFTRVIHNEISPVAYYLIMREMAPADVAARIGVSAAQVKKHMTPRHFGAMKISLALRYAGVFGIPLAALFQIPADPQKTGPLPLKNTHNPYVTTL